MTDMTDYSDLPTYEKKALLRSSADARMYRKNLIVFGCFIIVFALSVSATLISSRIEYNNRVAEFERWYASLDDETREMYEIFPAMLEMRRPERPDDAVFIALVPTAFVLVAVTACFAWKYYSVTHDPDNFELSVVRFGRAKRGFGRGARFYFTVTLRTTDGETKTVDTNRLFTHSIFETENDINNYENGDVLVAYNPVTDTLAVIKPI